MHPEPRSTAQRTWAHRVSPQPLLPMRYGGGTAKSQRGDVGLKGPAVQGSPRVNRDQHSSLQLSKPKIPGGRCLPGAVLAKGSTTHPPACHDITKPRGGRAGQAQETRAPALSPPLTPCCTMDSVFPLLKPELGPRTPPVLHHPPQRYGVTGRGARFWGRALRVQRAHS